VHPGATETDAPTDLGPMPELDEPAEPDPRRRLLTALAVLGAVAFALLGIGLPLVGHGTFSGADLILLQEPWKSTAPTGYQPQLPVVSDTIDSVLATHHFYREQLTHGNFPVWNPLAVGGSTLGTGISYAVFSPVNLPYLLLPTWLAPAWAKLLELLVAVGGSYLFLRRLRLTAPAAVVGGVLFASSGFMVTWTNWPQTQVAAFIPALFWAAERFAQTRTARSAVPIAVVIACLLLGGFPSVTGYACYAAAPYLLVRLLQLTGRDPLRLLAGVAKAGLALALGVGACAVSLLPFLDTLNDLDVLESRGQTPEQKLSPLMLLTTGVWRAFGTATGDGYWGPDPQIEGLSFLGAGALVLVAFALLRRPGRDTPPGVRWFFAVAAGVAVLLGYVGGPALELAQKLPVFSDNPVPRIRSVLGFFLAVLAAYGYDALVRTARERRPLAARAARLRAAAEVAGWVVVGAVALVAAKRLLDIGTDVGRVGYVKHQLLYAALPAAAVFAAGMAATALRRPGWARTAALGVVPLVVVAESLSVVLAFWPRADRDQFYPETPAHAFLADHLGPDRYAARNLTLFPGSNTYYGLRAPTGHSFTTTEWKELLQTLDPNAMATATFSRLTPAVAPNGAGGPLLDVMAVRYFVMSPSDPVQGVPSPVRAPAIGTLTPGRTVSVPLGTGGVRGVGLVLPAPYTPRDPFARVDVQVVSGDTVVASASRRFYKAVGRGVFTVPVAAETATGPLTARVTLRSDQPLPVASAQVVRPDPADGLDLVFADGAVVYQRDTALGRFRWADHAQVLPDVRQRLTVLANVRDPGRVVLSSPGPAGDGRPASVRVEEDSTDGSTVRVDAQGAGYLVVADADQDGWVATVDGRPADLVPADHAMVAVQVPPGSHEVSLRYTVPGRSRGWLVSAVSVLGLALMALATPLWRRRVSGRAGSG
jgi:hypothetical protein